MLRTRVIPCLLLSGDGLVKTINFKKPAYVGDPINAVRIFNDKEVDELILLDIDASRQCRTPNYEVIRDIVSEAFMPVAYGGGIKSLEHAKKLVELGVEKIVINSVALENTNLIKDLSNCFGASSTVVAIDIKKNVWGRYKLYNSRVGKFERKDWQLYLKEIIELGAGEILLNDISREGTGKGYNLEIIKEAVSLIDVPLIASGGAGNLNHFSEAAKAGASAVAAGSLFVYMGKHRAVMINYPKYELIEGIFLNV